MSAASIVPPGDPRGAPFIDAIRLGDEGALRAALGQHPELAVARFGDTRETRTALHLVTDHPGHLPNRAATIALLVAAGADVNARFQGSHRETPLHWAASCDDVEAIDALVALGADLEAGGAVLTDGPPLDDAVIFAQWRAAGRLVEHGATTRLFHAAALGLEARTASLLRLAPEPVEVTNALWHACRAGHAPTAALLLAAGGDAGWSGYDGLTPADAARRSGDARCASLFA